MFAAQPVVPSRPAVISKKVSFDNKYVLAFVAKRNRESTFYNKKLGREIEQIKRIYLFLTMKVIDSKYTTQLPQVVQVEVSQEKQGQEWIGITADIQENGWYVCKAQFILQEKAKSDEEKVEVASDDNFKPLFVNLSPIDGQ